MNKEQAQERVKNIKHEIEQMLKNWRNVFDDIFCDDDIQAIDYAIEFMQQSMTNREYMHLVGVQALFDTKFDLDAPLEKRFIEFLYALEQVEQKVEPYVRSDTE